MDDLAALDQKLMQFGVDAVDLDSKVGQGLETGGTGHKLQILVPLEGSTFARLGICRTRVRQKNQ
jgi:hypothetical protein